MPLCFLFSLCLAGKDVPGIPSHTDSCPHLKDNNTKRLPSQPLFKTYTQQSARERNPRDQNERLPPPCVLPLLLVCVLLRPVSADVRVLLLLLLLSVWELVCTRRCVIVSLSHLSSFTLR